MIRARKKQTKRRGRERYGRLPAQLLPVSPSFFFLSNPCPLPFLAAAPSATSLPPAFLPSRAAHSVSHSPRLFPSPLLVLLFSLRVPPSPVPSLSLSILFLLYRSRLLLFLLSFPLTVSLFFSPSFFPRSPYSLLFSSYIFPLASSFCTADSSHYTRLRRGMRASFVRFEQRPTDEPR